MVIDVIAATELLKQAGVDPSRIDIAHAFTRRRMLEVEHKAQRIQELHEGTGERDMRILDQVAPRE